MLIQKLRVLYHHMSLEFFEDGEKNMPPFFEGWIHIIGDVMEDIGTIDKALQEDWDRTTDELKKTRAGDS